MDNIVWIVWLITRIDDIKVFVDGWSAFFTFNSITVIGITAIIYFLSHKEEYCSYKEEVNQNAVNNNILLKAKVKPFIWLSCFSLFIGFFLSTVNVILPSKKDAMYIAAAWVSVKVATSDPAKELGAESLEVVKGFLEKTNLQLKEDIKELKKVVEEAPAKVSDETKAKVKDTVDQATTAAKEAAVEATKDAVKEIVK